MRKAPFRPKDNAKNISKRRKIHGLFMNSGGWKGARLDRSDNQPPAVSTVHILGVIRLNLNGTLAHFTKSNFHARRAADYKLKRVA